MACGSDLARVAREKSSKRRRSVTVRPTPLGDPHPAGDAVDDPAEDGRHVVMRTSAAPQRLLRSDGATPAADLHAARITIVAQRVELVPDGAADDRNHDRRGEQGDVAHRVDPAVGELGRRHPPDTPQPVDGQRVEELQLPIRLHDQQPIGFADSAGHLGEELGSRDTHGDRQADPLPHLPPQRRGDLARCAGDPAEAADVEECLVDGDSLDDR